VTVVDLLLLALFVWGVLDVLSGLRLLLFRVPVLLLGKLLAPRPRIGYSEKELQELARKNSVQPTVPPPEDVDENGIPFLR
jgi:hypothetical protein